MSNVQLSRDADYLICLIYKNYLNLRNSGISKAKAKSLGDSPDINSNIVPKWSLEDTEDTCKELIRKGFLNNNPYIHLRCGDMSLSDEGIIYMENRFKNNIKELTDFITKFIP